MVTIDVTHVWMLLTMTFTRVDVVTSEVTHVLTWLPVKLHTCWHGYQWRYTRVDVVNNEVTHVLTWLPMKLHTCRHGYQCGYTRVDMVTNEITHVFTRLPVKLRVNMVTNDVTHVSTRLPVASYTFSSDVTHVLLSWLYIRVDMITSGIISKLIWLPVTSHRCCYSNQWQYTLVSTFTIETERSCVLCEVRAKSEKTVDHPWYKAT